MEKIRIFQNKPKLFYINILTMRKILVQCIALMLFCVPQSQAIVYYANSVTGNDLNSGLTADLALKTFQAAFLKIVNGDTVRCSGVFDWSNPDETGDVDRNGFIITKSLTIIGDSVQKTIFQAAPTEKTLSRRVFYLFPGNSAFLYNLILRNGYCIAANAEGSGIYSGSNTTLKMKNCIVENNHNYATYGNIGAAGIHSEYLDGFDARNILDLENVIIRNNTSRLTKGLTSVYYTNGGGLSIFRVNLNMRNCTIHDNYAEKYGSGFYSKESTVNITNCTFCYNTSNYDCFRLENNQRQSYISNCTIAYNKSKVNHIQSGFASIVQVPSDTFAISFRNNIFHDNLDYKNNDSLSFYVASNFKNKIEWKNNYFQNGFIFNNNLHQVDTFFKFSPQEFGNIIGKRDSVLLSANLSLNNSPDGIPTLALNPGSFLVDKGINDDLVDAYTSVVHKISTRDQRRKVRSNQVDIGAFEYFPVNKMNEQNKQILVSQNQHQFEDLIVDESARILLNESDSLIIQNSLIIEGNDSTVAEISNAHKLKFSKKHAKIIYSIKFKKGGWRFFSLPFQVPAMNIYKNGLYSSATWGDPVDYVEGKDFYIAKYNGQRRAELNSSTGNWENVNERVIKAGEGYIIAVDKDVELVFVADSVSLDQSTDNKSIPGFNYNNNSSYFNTGWNFTGNPLTSSSDISPSMLQTPIYTFNGYNYETYVDDDICTLKPLSSFLYQAYNNDSVTFASNLNSGTLNQSVPAYLNPSSLIKIKISNKQYQDVTKIKTVESASADFEPGTDAFKLLSMNKSVPQIFTRNNEVDFAFNKIPYDYNELNLIVLTPDSGMHTISLRNENENDESRFILINSMNQVVADLSNSDYKFFVPDDINEIKFKLVIDRFNQTTNNLPDNLILKKQDKSIEIQTDNEQDMIEILDLSGKLLQSLVSLKNKQIFQLPNHGLYIFKIYRTDKTFVKKISI